jgi:hypothetical protein
MCKRGLWNLGGSREAGCVGKELKTPPSSTRVLGDYRVEVAAGLPQSHMKRILN